MFPLSMFGSPVDKNHMNVSKSKMNEVRLYNAKQLDMDYHASHSTYTCTYHFLDVFYNPTPHVTFTDSFNRSSFSHCPAVGSRWQAAKNLKLFCASPDTSYLSNLMQYNC